MREGEGIHPRVDKGDWLTRDGTGDEEGLFILLLLLSLLLMLFLTMGRVELEEMAEGEALGRMEVNFAFTT